MTVEQKARQLALTLVGEDQSQEPLIEVLMEMAEWQRKQMVKEYSNLNKGLATAKGLAVAMAYDKGVADAKEQMMAKAVDVTIAIPYQNGYGGYTQLLDSKEGLPSVDNIKVLVIKEG